MFSLGSYDIGDISGYISLILIFGVSTIIVWFAGIQLTKTTDFIDRYFKLGEAFGGVVFLAIVTNLPEIAIIISASWHQHYDLAIGNILGGIALQTVVLVVIDGLGLRKNGVLSYKTASMQPILSAVLVIVVLTVTLMVSFLPKELTAFRISVGDVFILTSWLVGVWLIQKARYKVTWHLASHAKPTKVKKNNEYSKNKSIFVVLFIFGIASLFTLLGGFALEETSHKLATLLNIDGVIMGATLLAAATALPEVSTGFAAIKLGDYTMVYGDIFGGNAFLPTLFLLGTIIIGHPFLSHLKKTDIYLTGLGIILTAIYIFGLIFRNKKLYFWLGIDSLMVLIIYILGILGLVFITKLPSG